jgi:D-alanyl-D-alanine dipeptidase
MGLFYGPEPLERSFSESALPPRPGRITRVVAPAAHELATVEPRFRADPSRAIQLHRAAYDAFRRLKAAAEADGIPPRVLTVVSGYRSVAHQERLWERALRRYGSEREARKWVARPGGSPHHTGRAIDFFLGTRNDSANIAVLRATPAYRWLVGNAARFGFAPYPREPWHWEYNPPGIEDALRPAPPRPSAARATPAPSIGPAGPFGLLTARVPGLSPFSYRFTDEDVRWTARFLVGEAGGRDTPENRAVIWAMFNRYAFFTHRNFPAFHLFLRAYSTPLQPVLRSRGASRRHMHRPEFVRTGTYFDPPYDHIPRGQLRRHLELQNTPWESLPEAARALAEQALKGRIPNPVGNASEFASTLVYFRDAHRRKPTEAEWRAFTEAFARRKGWVWMRSVPGLTMRSNQFFATTRRVRPHDTRSPRFSNLPPGAVSIVAT